MDAKFLLNLFFGFKGCINRTTYIFSILWMIIFYVILLLISAYFTVGIENISNKTTLQDTYLYLYTTIMISITYNSIALSAKRFKDIGLSPWNSLLVVVPYISWIVILLLYIIPPKKENNRYCVKSKEENK